MNFLIDFFRELFGKSREEEANQLLEQGVKQFEAGHIEVALRSEEEALTIYQEIEDYHGIAAALGNMGNAYHVLGHYDTAIQCHELRLNIARELHDPKAEGQALGDLGIVYRTLGDYNRAVDYQRQHLTIAREIPDQQGEINALSNLGNAYYSRGDYLQANECYQHALTIAREREDLRIQLMVMGNLGNIYGVLADYPKAILSYQECITLAHQLEAPLEEAYNRNNLANVYCYLGDYRKALEQQQESLTMSLEMLTPLVTATALGGLGNIYMALGDFPKARGYYEQALSVAREIRASEAEEYALGNLGLAYFFTENYEQAINYQQQRLDIAQKNKTRRGEVIALENLGIAYYRQGDYTQAIDYLQQSLAKAYESKYRLEEETALGDLGVVYDTLGNYTQSINCQQKRLVIARNIGDKRGEGQALHNLSYTLFLCGNFEEAEKKLREAVDIWEFLRGNLGSDDINKVSIFELQIRTYRLLQRVLIAQHKTEHALEIAEQGRARAFVELLSSRLFSQSTNQAAKNSIPPTIQQMQEIAKEHKATLVEYSLMYDDLRGEIREEARESELFIWVVTSTGEIMFRQVDLKPLWQRDKTSLADLVFRTHESLAAPGRDARVRHSLTNTTQSIDQNLHQFDQLLIQPIVDLLPTDSNAPVIFIPQGPLFMVPFSALLDTNNTYLIERHTIITAPAIKVLEQTHQQLLYVQQAALQEVLVVGNPSMPSFAIIPDEPPQPLPTLRYAEREAIDIARILNTKALIGNSATKATVVQQMLSARLIHLATHGLLDDWRGLGSAIALAPSREDTGLLTAEEIVELQLHAELVTLSACDTGGGRLTGDGVVGLSRSFISTGVPSILVSLWSVRDEPTASLMTEFYQNFRRNTNKAQALRQAMLTTMKRYTEPSDWAAFTLIGEP